MADPRFPLGEGLPTPHPGGGGRPGAAPRPGDGPEPRFAPEPDPDVDPYLDRNPGPDPGPDDATAALLRGALRRQAENVQPSAGGLARILAAAHRTGPPTGRAADTVPSPPRTPSATSVDRPGRISDTVPLTRRPLTPPGTADERPHRLARWAPVLAAAAAVMIVFSGLGLARPGWVVAPGLDAVVGGAPAVGPSHPPPVEPLPVYLVEHQFGHWALVREFSPTTLTDPLERLSAAVRLAVAGTGADADHTSAWRAVGEPASAAAEVTVTRDADGIVVRLPPVLLGTAPTTADSAPLAQLAVQQLVWTATATVRTNEQVRIEGPFPGSLLFGADLLGTPVGRDGPDPRAPVWVASLVDGQRLVPGRAVIQGDAVQTPRGAVAWRLVDESGTQLNAGFAPLRPEPAGTLPVGGRGVWEVTLQLPAPGRYRFEVRQPWPGTRTAADPAWMKVDWVDSKTLLVQ
jgi:hypothetical protein